MCERKRKGPCRVHFLFSILSSGLAATNSLYHARFFFRARDVIGLRKSASRFGVLLLVWRKDRPGWTVNREREPIAP